MKFNDEQLSRILGEHSISGLKKFGGALGKLSPHGGTPYKGCVLQVAFNRQNAFEGAGSIECVAVFDANYITASTPEALLDLLKEFSND